MKDTGISYSMGNSHSAETPRSKTASRFTTSSKRNRLSKPKLGAPPQTPLTAALTRTLSARSLVSANIPLLPPSQRFTTLHQQQQQLQQHSPEPKLTPSPPRTADAYGFPRRRSNASLTHNPRLSIDTSNHDASAYPTNYSAGLQRRDSFSSMLRSRGGVHQQDVPQPLQLDFGLGDDGFPPTTASSVASSYHSAAQSPTKTGSPSRQNSFLANDDRHIPVRRRSLLNAAAPGTASRPRPLVDQDSPTELTLSKLLALDLANPAGLRSETPTEIELTRSLGSFKKGSLFITNGAASPAPSSPELRAISYGSQHGRSPSLPNLPSLNTIPSDHGSIPAVPYLRPNNGSGKENFLIPRKPVGSSRNASGGRPNIQLDVDAITLSPGHGLRLVPQSPARTISNGSSDVYSDGRSMDVSDVEDDKPVEMIATRAPLSRTLSATMKDVPAPTKPNEISRSHAESRPVARKLYSFDLSSYSDPRAIQAQPITSPKSPPITAAPACSFSFTTVAETMPHRNNLSQSACNASEQKQVHSNPAVAVSHYQTQTLPESFSQRVQPSINQQQSYQQAMENTNRNLLSNSERPVPVNTNLSNRVGGSSDSGYSSSDNALAPPPKSPRRSQLLQPQPEVVDVATVGVVEIDHPDQLSTDETATPKPLPSVAYSTVSYGSPPTTLPTTPKRNRSFFSRKSYDRSVESTPVSDSSPSIKEKKTRRLSFRRKSSKGAKEPLQEPQPMPVTLPTTPKSVEIAPVDLRTEKAEPKSAGMSPIKSASVVNLGNKMVIPIVTPQSIPAQPQDAKPSFSVQSSSNSFSDTPRLHRKESQTFDRKSLRDLAAASDPIALTNLEQSQPSHAARSAPSVSYTGSSYYQRFSSPAPGFVPAPASNHTSVKSQSTSPQSDIQPRPSFSYDYPRSRTLTSESDASVPSIPPRKRPQSFSAIPSNQRSHTLPAPPMPKQQPYSSYDPSSYDIPSPLRYNTKSPPSAYKYHDPNLAAVRPRPSNSRPNSYHNRVHNASDYSFNGGAYPSMNRSSSQERWGVDFGDIPVLRPEDMAISYPRGRKSMGDVDADSDDDMDQIPGRRKTTFWSRSRSRSRTRMPL